MGSMGAGSSIWRLRRSEPSRFARVLFVSAFDRRAPPAPVLAPTLDAVFKPDCAVLSLFADSQPMLALEFTQRRTILGCLLLRFRHRRRLEVRSDPLEHAFARLGLLGCTFSAAEISWTEPCP